jgi:hypothetical protein
MIQQRFSQAMKDFHAEVLKLETSAKQAILAAYKAAAVPIKDSFRKLENGVVLPHFRTVLSELKSAVPTELRGDAALLARALDEEIQARGPNWGKEAAHLAIAEFLTSPLEAHLATIAPPAPGPADPATVAAVVAQLAPQIPTTAQVTKVASDAAVAAVPAAVAAHLAANPVTAPSAPAAA